jgi:uncharacterized protein YbjT (DUF2867 family)
MENFLEQVESIQRDRKVYFSYASDHDIPWISTDDIGDEAAKYLLDDRWAGQWTRNLMGSENLTLMEATAVLSQLLDHPIEYVRVAIESIQQHICPSQEWDISEPKVRAMLGCLWTIAGAHND